MSHYKRIFIVGHPGAGKALLAKKVAEKLGWQFIDADLGIEFAVGRSLKEILGNEGQESFFRCQSELLSTLLSKEHIVVATDGTIICSEENRHLLASECVVFLQVSTEVQVGRISRDQAPLLPIADLETFFDRLHSERDHLFAQAAKVLLNSDDNALEQHVLSLVEMVTKNKEVNDHVGRLNKKDLILFHKTLHTPIHLSEQQAISLKLLAQGKSSKEIARAMNISYRTVEGTLAKTMELLGCSSSKELIVLYHDKP